jgi:hypothetical protein
MTLGNMREFGVRGCHWRRQRRLLATAIANGDQTPRTMSHW